MSEPAVARVEQGVRLEGAALRLLSDERLARMSAQGNRAAFEVIFDRYHRALFGYCASLLHNREDAADAVQSTMERAMRALEGEGREIAVRPWLYSIAHNVAIDLLRRPRSEPAGDVEVVTVSDVEADAATRERLRVLLGDIRTLPGRQRGALVMRELSGLSYEEIAAALETSTAGAKQAVYDARQALHHLALGRDLDCDTIRRKLSEGDRRVFRGRAVRAHLTACAGCRSWQGELAARERSWAAFAPAMPAAAGALTAAGGGGAGAAAAGSFAGYGAGAAASALATVAVAVVLGAGAVGGREHSADDHAARPSEGSVGAAVPVAQPRSDRAAKRDGRATPRERAQARRRADAREKRADRARARARARRVGAAPTGSAGDGADHETGEGSTALGGGGGSQPQGSYGDAGGRTQRGGRVRDWLGGRGDGEPGDGGSGPIRSTVDGTRDAVQGTVDQVQGALPVPTPPVSLPAGRRRAR